MFQSIIVIDSIVHGYCSARVRSAAEPRQSAPPGRSLHARAFERPLARIANGVGLFGIAIERDDRDAVDTLEFEARHTASGQQEG